MMNRTLIRIIGDSLALPRPWQGLFARQTYPILLQELLEDTCHVLNCSTRANTIAKELQQRGISHLFDPDTSIWIFHLGLVDGAPRLFTEEELEAISPLSIKKDVVELFSQHRMELTRKSPKVYVPLTEYEDLFRRIVEYLASLPTTTRILLVNIAGPALDTPESSHSQWENMERYSAVLQGIASATPKTALVDIRSSTMANSDLLLSDKQHLSSEGHRQLATLLSETVLTGCTSAAAPHRLHEHGRIDADLCLFFARSLRFFSGVPHTDRYFRHSPDLRGKAAALALYSEHSWSPSSQRIPVLSACRDELDLACCEAVSAHLPDDLPDQGIAAWLTSVGLSDWTDEKTVIAELECFGK